MRVVKAKLPQLANIYNLDLHQSIFSEDGSAEIMRVPGGWIYKFYDYIPSENGWILVSSEFVEYNEEFMQAQNFEIGEENV